MTKEDRRKCIDWMLNQIEVLEKAHDDMVLSDGTLIEQCGTSDRVHVYNGFDRLVEAAQEEVRTEDFNERQLRESFMFCGTEFMCLVEKTYEEQAE